MSDTQLTEAQQKDYTSWLSAQSAKLGRDLSKDSHDYDMQGWWKKNGSVDLSSGHFTDEFKKPNHPTFSDESIYHGKDGNEGGSWIPLDNGQFMFLAGKTNKENHSPEFMQQYFDKVEPNNILAIPADTYFEGQK